MGPRRGVMGVEKGWKRCLEGRCFYQSRGKGRVTVCV